MSTKLPRINFVKLICQVLDVLTEGPATSGETAIELGISPKSVSATLSDLERDGIVKTVGKTYRNPQNGGYQFIRALVSQR